MSALQQRKLRRRGGRNREKGKDKVLRKFTAETLTPRQERNEWRAGFAVPISGEQDREALAKLFHPVACAGNASVCTACCYEQTKLPAVRGEGGRSAAP